MEENEKDIKKESIKGDFGKMKECMSKAEEVRVVKIDREEFLRIIGV